MRGLIDAARQPGYDDKAGIAEIARQLGGELQPGAGGIARADDRNHRPHQRLRRATYAKHRGRVIQRRQSRRVADFIGCEQADADVPGCSQFSHRILLAADATGTRGAAAPGQIGQLLQCRPRVAEMAEEGGEGSRADIVGTIQPQPVNPLRIGEMGCGGCSVVHADTALPNRRV